jgi:hypothetical protein
MNDDVIDRANDVRERLFKLDDAYATLDGFCSLLKESNSRSPIQLFSHEHVHVAATVRAGFLRSAIGLVVAMLDRTDKKRGNRASLGHITHLLKDQSVVDYLLGPNVKLVGQPILQKLSDASDNYDKLLTNPVFKQVKRLRNDEIGHLLVHDDGDPTPLVEYEDVFALADEGGSLLATLYEGLGLGTPKSIARKERNVKRAKLFWDTYLAGVAAFSGTTPQGD